MSKLYVGGSLFNEAEVNQRLKEGNMIESLTNYEVYNPIQAPCNDKSKLPTSEDIFWGDTNEILESDVVIMDMSNMTDLGCATEVGIIWMCNYIHKLAEEGKTLEDKDECEMVYKDGVGTKKYGTWIRKGDRICQFRIMENQPPIEFEEVESLGNKDRHGIGSTGSK